MAGLRLAIVDDPAELTRLRPAWVALWALDPAATPFQHPAWLLPWWRHFGTRALRVLAVWQRGELAALWPLYILEEHGTCKLLPVGAGISDYLDPLGRPAAVPLLAEGVAELATAVDRVDLWPLRPGPLTAGGRLTAEPIEPCPVLTLPPTGETPCPALQRRLAKLPYYRRRAAKLGEARLVTATAGDLSTCLEGLFALHARRWSAAGDAGVLADPIVVDFHRAAAAELQTAGLLRLHLLLIDGRAAAVFYGFADRTRHHAYLGGWDPDLPHPGLGAMLIGHAVEAAMAEGARELHFLRGREPYKYSWGAIDRPLYGLSSASHPAAGGASRGGS